MVVGRQRHTPAALLPGISSGNFSKGGWVGPRAILDVYEDGKMSCPNHGLNLGVSLYPALPNGSSLMFFR